MMFYLGVTRALSGEEEEEEEEARRRQGGRKPQTGLPFHGPATKHIWLAIDPLEKN